MHRVVVDTNVVVSAILFGGKPRLIMQAALEGTVELYISEEMMQELLEVLRRPKFGLDGRLIQSILTELTSLARWVDPHQRHRVVKEDPADDRVIDCAVAGKVESIITGDKHLLKLARYQKIKILTPEEFVHVLGGAERSGRAAKQNG